MIPKLRKRGKVIAARMDAIENKLLAYVKDYQAKHNYNPSVREMSMQLGKSTSMIRFYLKDLEDKGRIERPIGIARSIFIKE